MRCRDGLRICCQFSPFGYQAMIYRITPDIAVKMAGLMAWCFVDSWHPENVFLISDYSLTWVLLSRGIHPSNN